MLLKISEFRHRIDSQLDQLVRDLQALTNRYSHAEEQAWRSSLPKISKVFSAASFNDLDIYFGSKGNLALEYRMPAANAWADMILLGKHNAKPAVVIVELKDWVTQGDLPGYLEGLMIRHGQSAQHPSDQVLGYVEYCRRFHSQVQRVDAVVHGCVVFTKDQYFHTYGLSPNDSLANLFPCFYAGNDDEAVRFPAFFKNRLTEPDQAFAEHFVKGVYKQSRGFIHQIGGQILDPDKSPFVLLDNQRTAFALVRSRVLQSVAARRPKKAVILIDGPPGSGKSVVAAKVWASLATDPKLPDGNIVVVTTSASQNSNWRYLFKLVTNRPAAAGAVVSATGYTPLTTGEFGALRKKYPGAFKKEIHWRDNMNMLRSIAPNFRSGSKDEEFLVSIVDEAHAMINPEHVEGRGQYGFTTALGPQAYQIMRASTVTVFLFDSKQGFRDRENTTVEDIKKWAQELGINVVEEISLDGGQFRCAGSKEYVDWVDSLLGFAATDGNGATRSTNSAKNAGATVPPSGSFAPFEVDVLGTLGELETALCAQISKGHSARLLASYARKWKTEGVALPHGIPPELMDFDEYYELDGKKIRWNKVWNFVPNGNDYTHFIQAPAGSKMHSDQLCEVGCPYAVRGFDFDYVGLLWFSDLKWRNGRWVVDPDHVFERGIKARISAARKEADPDGLAHESLLRAVQSAYRIILTRPMKGIYIWCEDFETREYLKASMQRGKSL